MCNLIHACQTAIFDWLKHSICINMKCRERKKKVSLSSWVIYFLLDSSTLQYGQVESPNPVKYTSFIHPSVHPSPLSIYPVWSRVTGVSPQLGMREKKGQFSMYCIFRKKRFPLGAVAIGTSEALHRLTFFQLTDEKCSNCFVCRSLKMYGWSEAFAAEATLTNGNATKAGRAVAQFYFWEHRICANMQSTLQNLRIPDSYL